jgi:hypothetical protein
MSVKGKRCKRVDKFLSLRGKKRKCRRKKQELKNEHDNHNGMALRAIVRTYPDTEVPDAFVYGYVTLRFNPDGSFLTKLNLNGLLPNCLNCGAHAHE